jgi:integrase
MSYAKPKRNKAGKVIKYAARYRDAEGAERSAGYYRTKKAAEIAAAEEEIKVYRGRHIGLQQRKITFAQYYEHKWLPSRASRSLNTRENYRHAYESCVRNEWGQRPLSSISRGDVQSWIDAMVAFGVSAQTIRKRYQLLHMVLAARRGTSALADGLIEIDPCQAIDLPEISGKPVDVYSPDEFEKLVEHLPTEQYRELAIFQAETGLRWGELMGIQIDRFTVGRRKLVIQRTIVQTKTEVSGTGTRFSWKDEPKGRTGRSIAVSLTARGIADGIVARHDLKAGDRLFSRLDSQGNVLRSSAWPEGVPLNRDTWRAVWHQASADAGLRRLRPHTLRGSNLSWLLNGGDIDPNTVREHAGHKSLLTTQKYLGAMPDADDRLLAALERTKARYTGQS